jgi:hypothetical protein
MKKLLLIIATLSLSSCIPVDDWGVYWDKGTIDKRLAGKWINVPANSIQSRETRHNIDGVIELVEKAGVYELSTPSGKAEGEPSSSAKTISAGPYELLAIADKKGGTINRYKVTPQNLEFCQPIALEVMDFIKREYPNAADRMIANTHGNGPILKIGSLSDETVRILSGIPNTGQYWFCDYMFKRLPNE